MKQTNKKCKTIKNLFFGFGTKILTMALGIILPRLFITSYGSETNGLLSTITQIFTYMALLQAGIGSATINALYKPLDDDNWEQINEVFSQARSYYRRVALVYAVAVLFFSFIYSAVVDSTLDRGLIFAIILLQGIASFITYYFCASYTQLLVADGKQYISDNITFAVHVATSAVKIVLVSLGFNVLVVQAAFLFLTILTTPITIYICKKQYSRLKPYKTKSKELLQERGAFIVHEVSSVIFSNTDIFLISTFCSLAMASVYSVYNLVFGALNSMINTANAGLGYILGQSVYGEKEKLINIYDIYSSMYALVVFAVMTTAYILITPFVAIYTNGINDISYIMPGIALMFTLINLMSGVRAVAARLITVSGHASATQTRSVIEAVINLVTSIVFVNLWGIYGVLLGTIVALLYRTNDIIIYANKNILERSPLHEYIQIIAYVVSMCILIFTVKSIGLYPDTFLKLILSGAVVFPAVSVLYLIPLFIVNHKALFSLIRKLKSGS